MIGPLLALVVVGAPAPFDHTVQVSWDRGDRRVRAQGVADSSASDLGDAGVRLRAEAKTADGRLAVLDLDLRPTGLGRIDVGPSLLARYDELTPAGVGFHASRSEGRAAVTRLRRSGQDASIGLSFDLVFTDSSGGQRTISGVASTPPPIQPAVDDVPAGPPNAEVAAGCVWADSDDPYDDDWSSADGDAGAGGCEGDPGPGSGSSSDSGDGGCEGDPGPSNSGGVSDAGCEGDPSLRSARAHGPLALVGLLLGLRRRRRTG